MARQEIDLTTPQPNGKMGEPTKAAWEKVNDMTAEIYSSPAMSGSLSSENMLISCGIPVNQSLFAGGNIAAGAYGYDIWKAGSGGCNLSISSTTGLFTHNSGSIQQIIESPIMAWGNALTFSVENPSADITVSVGGSSAVITSGSGRRSVTITPTGSGNMIVQITASGATYLRPKLERGQSPTPFVPVPYAIDLLMVQRYYEVGKIYLFGCVGASGGWNSVQCDFKSQKRTVPTMIYPVAENSTNIAQTIPVVDVNSLSVRGIPAKVNQNFIYVGGFIADARL